MPGLAHIRYNSVPQIDLSSLFMNIGGFQF
jgi:hypothetical protein